MHAACSAGHPTRGTRSPAVRPAYMTVSERVPPILYGESKRLPRSEEGDMGSRGCH